MNSLSSKTFSMLTLVIFLDIFAGVNMNVLFWGVFLAIMGAGARAFGFPFKGFWPTISGAMAGILLGTAVCYLMRDSTGYLGIVRDVITLLFGAFGPETITGIKGPYREAVKKRFKKFTDEL